MLQYFKRRPHLILLIYYIVVFFVVFSNLMITAHVNETKLESIHNQYTTLETSYNKLKEEAVEYQNAIDRMNGTLDELQDLTTIDTKYGVTKTWMSYKSLSSPEEFETGWVSPQWKVNLKAHTDEKGFRRVDDYYCIAIGFGWGYEVGDILLVVLSTGESFEAVMGDQKAWEHTDEATHKVHKGDNSVVEFIIDPDVMDPYYSRIVGIQSMPEFAGSVVGIYKLGELGI